MFINTIILIKIYIIKTIRVFGRAWLMLFYSFYSTIKFKKQIYLILNQIYNLGTLSIIITVISGLFIGMILGLQSYLILIQYGTENNLGLIISTSLIRELGPVITAILFVGRSCSSLTTEIGLMNATEQLSSMEMMAIDPLNRIILPRFLAGIITLPLLTIIFIAAGIWGGYLVAICWKNGDYGFFWSIIKENIDLKIDLINSLIKSIVFAIVVTWIALFNGYDATSTSEGVSKATTNTVVYGILSILSLDFLLTILMFGN